MSSFSGDLFVFTNNGDELLIESGHRNGIEIYNRVATFGEDYVTTKLRRGVESLKTHGADHAYAMWVDGLDTLILKPEDNILHWLLRGYVKPGCVVIAAERSCWPDANRRDDYPYELRQKEAFINSGCFIGETAQVIKAMEMTAALADSEDDQRAWTAAFLEGDLPFLRVDMERQLCVCQSDGREYDTAPCVRHWNGRTPGRQEFFDGYFNGVL